MNESIQLECEQTFEGVRGVQAGSGVNTSANNGPLLQPRAHFPPKTLPRH